MTVESLELLQGTLDLLVLRTLAWQPMHGYGISQWIRGRTGDVLLVQDAALYQALRRLERKGWVDAEWATTENNRRARVYRLTAVGRGQLESELSAWNRYAEAVSRVLAPIPGEAS
ncbi:MAG TPA: PadR family transcriptional regulator [Longimicrobiales bacterium]|nr:PadR family transcriptional regulator [Longimicrobiales bacterium]